MIFGDSVGSRSTPPGRSSLTIPQVLPGLMLLSFPILLPQSSVAQPAFFQEPSHPVQAAFGSLLADPQLVFGVVVALVLVSAILWLSRQREHEALSASEENLAVTLRSIGDGVLATDAKRRVTWLNPVAEKLTGWTQAQAIGRPVDEVFRIINETSRQPTAIPVDTVLNTGKIQALANHTTLIARDGSERPIADSAAPIRDKAGRILGVVMVFRDVTEERQAQLEIRQLNESLEQRVRERTAELTQANDEICNLNATLEQRVRERTTQLEVTNKELEAFSYSVSHDLRAPLRHVQGYLDMLRRELGNSVSEPARRYMNTIATAATEMNQLIDDLLSFSRMGRAELHMTSISLDELVASALGSLELATRQRKINWKIAPLPAVSGDLSMLRQVLVNLVSNAVKYTRTRELAEIEIGCAGDEAGRFIFFVRDNGVGFDPKYAHRLFGVFQRLHRADEFEGTGIGLANVRRIITRHGGRTWAEGKPDAGATFYFTLSPATANPPAPA